MSAHAVLSVIARTPELALSDAESADLADALNQVNSLYSLSFLSEEAMAWINLTMVCGAVYGPRVIAYGIRKKHEREDAAEETKSPVVQFPAVN